MTPKVYCAIPTYNGQVRETLIASCMQASQKGIMSKICVQGFSSTTHNFNMLYCNALNLRKSDRITHFAMLHSDIEPEAWWLDKLWDLMQKHEADIVSAVVPIKNPRGITSTALDESVDGSDPKWRPRRLSMQEIMELPPTFTHEKLLVNDGCMLIDIRKPFAEKIVFRHTTEIKHHENGQFEALFSPDDWDMSRIAREHGAKIYATRELKLQHYGNGIWPNHYAWGSWNTDKIEK